MPPESRTTPPKPAAKKESKEGETQTYEQQLEQGFVGAPSEDDTDLTVAGVTAEKKTEAGD